MESTLDGKNLLLVVKILFFTSLPPLKKEAKIKMAKLLPIKVHILILNNSLRRNPYLFLKRVLA